MICMMSRNWRLVWLEILVLFATNERMRQRTATVTSTPFAEPHYMRKSKRKTRCLHLLHLTSPRLSFLSYCPTVQNGLEKSSKPRTMKTINHKARGGKRIVIIICTAPLTETNQSVTMNSNGPRDGRRWLERSARGTPV
jgi:hypothetical protein